MLFPIPNRHLHVDIKFKVVPIGRVINPITSTYAKHLNTLSRLVSFRFLLPSFEFEISRRKNTTSIHHHNVRTHPRVDSPRPTTVVQNDRRSAALSPVSFQASAVTSLFAKPDREIILPRGPKAKTLPPPPEIVANVQGSSAGAGSGEFHVYKAARRREYERIRLMEEEVKRENDEKEFLEKPKNLRRRMTSGQRKTGRRG